MRRRYDLVIVGLGSGGTLAAEFAAGTLGLRVAAVERGRIGGDCLWTGCVPSKTLIASARVAHTVRNAGEFGVGVREPTIDTEAVWRRIHDVQAEIAATDDSPDRFRRLGVDLYSGTGKLTGPHSVTVVSAAVEPDAVPVVLDTRFILVCTGSRPAVPPIAGLAGIDVLTTENLFELHRPPASLVVIGGGPIAIEIAQAMVRLDVATTVLEAAPRVLANEQPELADRLTRLLRAEGVEIHTSVTVESVRRHDDGVVVATRTGEHAAAGLMIAAGRTPNLESLGLEQLGIPIAPDGVIVDARSRTTVPSVYAVGDVAAGRPRFTHAAANDAVVAVRDMFFPGRGKAATLVPWCTFTDPELAHVGATEQQAIERYGSRSVDVHRHQLADNDRARADGSTEGSIVIVTAKGRIVGAHLLAPRASELIHELAIAITRGIRLSQLSEIVHIYPTISTSIGRIAADEIFAMAHRYRALARINRWKR
jgi:pyruvate/2-oxoglutarate dehydrogenase complex dihydrolipoamide dehydrogenase (E3) component